jgi:heme exporter protein B
MPAREVFLLLKKDIRLEFRQWSSFSSMLLYVASTLFICYLAFDTLPGNASWNALFWVIMLFSSTNAVLRGFIPEGRNLGMLYGTLVSYSSLIISRLIYNALVMMVIGLITLVLYIFLLGNPGISIPLFALVMFAGIIGFSSLLTMVSAISARSGQNFTLTAILGFPLAFPLVLLCLQLTTACFSGSVQKGFWYYLATLTMLDVLIISLSIVLFPFLWKD